MSGLKGLCILKVQYVKFESVSRRIINAVGDTLEYLNLIHNIFLHMCFFIFRPLVYRAAQFSPVFLTHHSCPKTKISLWV